MRDELQINMGLCGWTKISELSPDLISALIDVAAPQVPVVRKRSGPLRDLEVEPFTQAPGDEARAEVP
jgi:hypothetical protein